MHIVFACQDEVADQAELEGAEEDGEEQVEQQETEQEKEQEEQEVEEKQKEERQKKQQQYRFSGHKKAPRTTWTGTAEKLLRKLCSGLGKSYSMKLIEDALGKQQVEAEELRKMLQVEECRLPSVIRERWKKIVLGN